MSWNQVGDTLSIVLSSASKSETGNVRAINEDACLMVPPDQIWAVADGMGGHQSGDFASKLIMQSLSVIQPQDSLEKKIDEIVGSLNQVNSFLVNEAVHRGGNQTIGSTVVVFTAHENQCAVLWVGDSRLYRFQDSKLQQLTKDHSRVQELVDIGVIQPEEAESHPSANVITRAIGASEPVTIDIERFEMQPGDHYLLCSDGLYKELNEQEISTMMSQPNCNTICEQLIESALQRECRDNVTALVISVLIDEQTVLRSET